MRWIRFRSWTYFTTKQFVNWNQMIITNTKHEPKETSLLQTVIFYYLISTLLSLYKEHSQSFTINIYLDCSKHVQQFWTENSTNGYYFSTSRFYTQWWNSNIHTCHAIKQSYHITFECYIPLINKKN